MIENPDVKLVYVKRWRTIVPLPAKYADEIVEALRASPAATPTPEPLAPTDLDRVWQAAESCWASSAPQESVDLLYYEILRLIRHPITGANIDDLAAPVSRPAPEAPAATPLEAVAAAMIRCSLAKP